MSLQLVTTNPKAYVLRVVSRQRPDGYEVQARYNGNRLIWKCECWQTVSGPLLCQHLLMVLINSASVVRTTDVRTMRVVHAGVCGTPIEENIHLLLEAELELEQVRCKVKLMRSALGHSVSLGEVQ